MKDEEKTKDQLIEELNQLRKECNRKDERTQKIIRRLPSNLFRCRLNEDGEYLFESIASDLTEGCSLKSSDIAGKPVEEVLGGKTDSNYYSYCDRAFSGETVEFEIKVDDRWYLTELFPFKTGPDGEVVEIAGLAKDISEQKKAEEKLKLTQFALENATPAVLWVKPNGTIQYANKAACNMLGYSKEELLDLTIEDIDPTFTLDKREEQWNRLKEEKNMRFETTNRRKDGTEFPVEVTDHYLEYKGKEFEFAFVQDITDRKIVQGLMADWHSKLRKSQKKFKRSFIELAETASRVLGVRNPYTQMHQQNVGKLAKEVGSRMGLGEDRCLGLYIGGLLHDIGKINVPTTILTKSGELLEGEWKALKTHPEVGYDQILKEMDFPWPVGDMTLHHHEKLDGSGYPHGLEGEELSLEVRILGAADVVEALSASRPYRDPKPKGEVLEEIENGKGDKFDPEVVNVLTGMLEDGDNEVIQFDAGKAGVKTS